MRSTLVITTPASDLALLTIEELREIAGTASGDSPDANDAVLEAFGLAAAAAIMDECNIAAGSGGEPTLLKETLTETFYDVLTESLVLARRHNVVISSITKDGSLVSASDYFVDGESGIVSIVPGNSNQWKAAKIVVVYEAGFTAPPPVLKQAAKDTVNSLWSERERDPYVKATTVDVEGIDLVRTEYWASGIQAGSEAVPASACALLKRFKNLAFA